MREILFRGRRQDNGEWVEGFYCLKKYKYAGDRSFISATHKITTGIIEASGAYQEHEKEKEYTVIPETVGQYTGLTDKNGKKIFEGDIVISVWEEERRPQGVKQKKYEVLYDDGRRGYYPFACGDGCGCCEDETHSPKDAIVIGNIHDTPEYLEEREEE